MYFLKCIISVRINHLPKEYKDTIIKHIYTKKYLNIVNIEMKLPLYELGISVYDTFDLDFTFYYESDLYILDKVE